MMNSTPSINTIVRANQNAVMFRHAFNALNGNDSITYSIYDNQGQRTTYAGTLSSCNQAWNRNYRNSRQYIAGANGANHRYMS